jgi:hypothetical protein
MEETGGPGHLAQIAGLIETNPKEKLTSDEYG